MAAVTVTSRQDTVQGDLRGVAAVVSVANSGDTYNTGLNVIRVFSTDAGSAALTNTTVSGGTLTFVTGGAVTGIQVLALGY